MEAVNFSGHAGLGLSGVLHRPSGTVKDCDCVIICHGFRGSKDGGGRAISLSEKIAAQGIAALRFDFSGTRDSEGEFAGVTLSKYIQDLAGAIEFAGSVMKGKIILLGRY